MNDITDKNNTELNNVQEFKFKPTLYESVPNNGDIVKVEIMNEEFMSVDNSELSVKTEEVDIKIEPKEYESFQKNVTPPPQEVSQHLHKCKLCNFESKYRSNLNRHMKVHINPPDYKYAHNCTKCPFQSKCKNIIIHHMLTHKEFSEVTIQKCGLCTYETIRKKYLSRHLLTHTSSVECKVLVYKCPLCSFVTKGEDSLNEHIPTHENSLQVDKAKLWRNANYMKNYKIQIKETLYKCGSCEFETKYKISLIDHMFSHKYPANVKSYRCDICPYETKDKDKIISHVYTKIHKKPIGTTKTRDNFTQMIKSRFLSQFKSVNLKKENQV